MRFWKSKIFASTKLSNLARLKNPVEPKDVVKNWMRSKNTLEYLGLWEMLNNPDFKGVEFDPFLKGNIRDYASINQLICLSKMLSLSMMDFRSRNALKD